MRGLPRRSGAPYSIPPPQLEDATCVARLRALGAIPIGTTPMTEWGLTPIGCNAHRTMPRNPTLRLHRGGLVHGMPAWPSRRGSYRLLSARTAEGRSAFRPR